MAIYRVALRFSVDHWKLPPSRALHYALEQVRAIEVEAPTTEIAEAHVDLLRQALEVLADH